MKKYIVRSIVAGAVVAGAFLGLPITRGEALTDHVAVTKTGGAQCVSSPIGRVQVLSSDRLLIEDRSGNAAVLKLSGTCLNDPSVRIGLELSPGSEAVCDKNDVTVHAGLGGTIDLNCSVVSVNALTPDQTASYRNGAAS